MIVFNTAFNNAAIKLLILKYFKEGKIVIV